MYGFEAMTFNIHGGYLEAIVRGYRSGLLTSADYNNLCQCETLDDIKMHLSATEYGPYLQNEPSPLHTTTIVEKCTLKLVDEYKHMLTQATEPLSTFLEYITYGHMIDNVVLIVTGTLHERDVQELLEKCHPLGMFDSIATLAVAQNMRELYRLVLVDTPLAPYFSECITSEDLDDMNIEIMRNTLYKAYLEDFYRFCQKLGGATAEIMSDLLSFEADRRAVNISINSIGTELTRDDRRKLYSNFEPSPLHTTTIVEKCTLKLVDEYKHMLTQATEPLSTFLEYITYGHMIDNVVLIVTGTLHERDVQELLEKCHPLGMFDSIATLAVAQNMRELYRLVLVDTPLAPYFSECITSEDLDDMNIEIMRNTLYKAYLEDFYRFCQKLGGATAEIMSDLLSFEADRRAVNISINSIGTELTRDDRRKLYSNFGLLYPYGHEELAVCEDIDQVRGAMEKYPPYQAIFSKLSYGESQILDKAFYEEEVKRLCLAFEQQFHYGVFFAYMRLREQEIRNLMWISECVAQNQKSRVHDSVVFIF